MLAAPEPRGSGLVRLGRRLRRSFYARPTARVARDLLGKTLNYDGPAGRQAARIVEVEAYLGARDPASHAYRGPTLRTAPMFGPPGRSYVYFVYGMYHCLNVVTERNGVAGAVLLRGAEPLAGFDDLEPLVVRSPRIGLNKHATTSMPWRLYVRGSTGVSRP
ncbi:MAG: DNA-3-methyladenine glycosylase [Chloroflexi bacterium]|nr:MAG: DNA-3-methyladenine glycosylase [Chloroflexota bacterium]